MHFLILLKMLSYTLLPAKAESILNIALLLPSFINIRHGR